SGMARTNEGHVLIAGTRDASTSTGDCSGQERLIVGELGADAGLRIVYTDNDSYKSKGTAVFSGPKGTVFVLGQDTRIFAIRSRMDLTHLNMEEELLKGDRAEINDAIILQLDSDRNLLKRRIVSGGASLLLADGIAVGRRVMAVGSFGLEWVRVLMSGAE